MTYVTRTLLSRPESAPISGSQAADTLREFLLTKTTSWLFEELLTAAEASSLLRARLEVAAGAEPVADVSRILARLDRAAGPADYVHCGEAASFADGIRGDLDAVAELRTEGFAAAAIEVLEHAIELLEEAQGYVDDSDGEVGGVLADAQEMHAQACIEAMPDPVELAERLARWALRSDCEVFLDSPSTHADALAESGLARFSEIVDEVTARGLDFGCPARCCKRTADPIHPNAASAHRSASTGPVQPSRTVKPDNSRPTKTPEPSHR